MNHISFSGEMWVKRRERAGKGMERRMGGEMGRRKGERREGGWEGMGKKVYGV